MNLNLWILFLFYLHSPGAEGHYVYTHEHQHQHQTAGCTPSSLDESLESADTALLTYIKAELRSRDSAFDLFKAKIQKVYQGCGCQRRDHVFVKSPRGLGVHAHQSFVLFGSISYEHIMGYHHHQPVLTVDPCKANNPFYHLSWSNRNKLYWFQNRSCETQVASTSESYDAGSQDSADAREEAQRDPYTPNDSCTPADCGPLPPDGNEETLCPDLETTIGLGASKCVYNMSTYKCEWGVKTCPSCRSDAGCRQDQICDSNGFCAPAQCFDDAGCPQGDQFCEAGRCKTCYCDSGTPLALCPDRETMGGGHASECLYVDGSCKREFVDCPKCAEDTACRSDQICVDGFCHPAQCKADDECAADEVCDAGRCVQCDCGAPRSPFLCHDLIHQGDVAGSCLRGQAGHCDYEYSRCDDCSSSDDCYQLEKGLCFGGQCKSAECLFDSHCSNNEVCEDYHCIPCDCGFPDREEFLCHDLLGHGNVAGDCVRSPGGQCVFEYSECDACVIHSDCQKLDKGVCVNGLCESAQCLDDSHCSYNEVCGAHECVPCDCGYPDRDEFLCHDLIGLGDVASDCFRAPNGQCVFKYSECRACFSHDECHKLDNGICVDGRCESAQCLNDTQCAYNEVCSGHNCIPCDCGNPNREEFLCHDLISFGNVAGDCFRSHNGVCVLEYTECEACSSDEQCHQLDKGICVDGQCENAQCLADNHCAYNEVCKNFECVLCDCGYPDREEFLCHDLIGLGNVAGDCYRFANGQCSFEYSECEQCSSDEQCHKLDKGICVDGRCETAQCLADTHCAYNEVCESFECIPCDCGYPDREEFLCHDLIGFGNVAGDCFRSPNGQCVFEYSECEECSSDAQCHKLDKGICVDGRCDSAQCLADNHCAYNEVCENFECVRCDCGSPDREEFLCHDLIGFGNIAGECYRATDGQCVREYSECALCIANPDCHKLDKGICVDGQCASAQCLSDSHCATTEVCVDYQCVPCDCGRPDRAEFLCHDHSKRGNVPGTCYRSDQGQCVYEYSTCDECTSDGDCYRLDKGICVGGGCESAQCLIDSHCSSTEVCRDNHCVACDCGRPDRAEFLCHDHSKRGNVPGICYRSDAGQCVYEYSTCDKCDEDGNCYRLDKGICNNGECASAECLEDDHCGHDEVCLENHCTKCDCGRIDKEEYKCHDNVNFGNVPGPCLRENGSCVQEYSTCDPCGRDSDCSQVYNGVCRGGTCESAECLLANQCNDSQDCAGGFCVACDCGNPSRDVTRCFDGTLAGPDKCIRNGGSCAWTYKECPICDVDFSCPYGFTCEHGECVEAALTCESSYDCPHFAQFCLNGFCSEEGCRKDKDCCSDEVCTKSGHCAKKQPSSY